MEIFSQFGFNQPFFCTLLIIAAVLIAMLFFVSCTDSDEDQTAFEPYVPDVKIVKCPPKKTLKGLE